MRKDAEMMNRLTYRYFFYIRHDYSRDIVQERRVDFGRIFQVCVLDYNGRSGFPSIFEFHLHVRRPAAKTNSHLFVVGDERGIDMALFDGVGGIHVADLLAVDAGDGHARRAAFKEHDGRRPASFPKLASRGVCPQRVRCPVTRERTSGASLIPFTKGRV